MPATMGVTDVDASELVTATVRECRAGNTILVLGPPGIGKTTIMRGVGKILGLPVEEMIGSNYGEVDVSGFPVIVDGVIKRVPFPILRRAIREPILLVIDEFTGIPRSLEPVMMRLVLERRLEDDYLHAGTRIAILANDPEHVGSGTPLSAAMVGRAGIFRFRPTVSQVSGYFKKLADGEDDVYLSAAFGDFARLVSKHPTLLAFDPPSETVNGSMSPWASPRQWEKGMRVLAECYRDHADDADVAAAAHRAATAAYRAATDDKAKAKAQSQVDAAVAAVGAARRLTRVCLAGHVGAVAAQAYLSLRELESVFPSPEEIADDPLTAKIPADLGYQLAAMAMIEVVTKLDVWAAWIYASRFDGEIKGLMGRMLVKAGQGKATSKWLVQGKQAQLKLLAAVGQAARRGQ